MVAGEYWLLNKAFGWTFKDPVFRWPIVCTALMIAERDKPSSTEDEARVEMVRRLKAAGTRGR